MNNSDDNSRFENELEQSYQEYVNNFRNVYPGSKFFEDMYCKLISRVENEDHFLKPATEQMEYIKKVKDLFENVDEKPKMLYLYPDSLQHTQMKDLEYKNSPQKVKEELTNFYILKFFKLNNMREKIITKSNQILNFYPLDEKFVVNKDLKITKINSEMDSTMKRIFRLLTIEEERTKDFEYYLRHFKVKKLDAFFVKQEQPEMHFNLRKDDFEVYFREICYTDKITSHVKSFESIINFLPLKNPFETWKSSKIYLYNTFKKIYDESIKRVKDIYNSEKLKCESSDMKLFKEYFKTKYKFYYELKEKFDEKINEKENNQRFYQSYNYDIIYPPLIISLNSEIRYFLKELCDHFNIKFDISIDKGKAFSYSIDLFFPDYFNQQSKNFSYNAYELTLTEMSNVLTKAEDSSTEFISLDTKATQVLRNKYNLTEGFVVNGSNKLFVLSEKLRNTAFVSEIYVKKALWLKYLCIHPKIDNKYILLKKQLETMGHIDSLLKFEMELIDIVDFNTLGRLIDDYTINISTRVRNTVKMISTKKEDDGTYSKFRDLVKNILDKNVHEDNKKEKITNDEYADKVDGDLLKYFIILRFLKLRDFKFFIVNLLNYFRFIQKRFALDLYKIENKNWKKIEDYNHLTETLSGTINNKTNRSEMNENLKKLIDQMPLSEYTKTNPIIPALETFAENKKHEKEFNRILLDEIDEIIEYSDKTIRIKDNKGNFILYDATLSDMKQLENEMAQIATFYIQKREELVINTDTVPNPFIDRSQVVMDLFTNEYEYLYSKFEYITELMTIYDNTQDIYLQKSLMQTITDIIAKRPIVDLNFHYFAPSYLVETETFRKKAAFIHSMIDYQKKIEINENKLLHESIDKFHWMLGETALEIIKHIRIDKFDIEMLKMFIARRRKEMAAQDYIEKNMRNKNKNLQKLINKKESDKFDEIESLLNIFEGVKKEKDLELNIDLNNKDTKNQIPLDKNPYLDKILINDSIEDESSKSQVIIENNNEISSEKLENNSESSIEEETKNIKNIAETNEKVLNELNILIVFMKKLFTKAVSGTNEEFIENTTESLIKTDTDGLESIKEILNFSINQSSEKNRKQGMYTMSSRSYSISNTSLDLMNYQIRSLLNIPNPFQDDNYLKFIERNPLVVNSLYKDINFNKFDEGYPTQFIDHAEFKYSHEIEFFESLSQIIPLINKIEKSFEELNSQFVSGDLISSNGLEVCYLDLIIEKWDHFKEYISGRKNIAEFDQIYFLQNTLIDDHQGLMYIIKTLTAGLSNNISRIPPHLLVKIPITILEKIDIDKIDFTIYDANSQDPSKIENLILQDLVTALINTLMTDLKSDWLKFKDDFSEVRLYCNLLEMYRTKGTIFKLVNNSTFLKSIYENQKEEIFNKLDDMFTFRENLKMEPPNFSNKPNYVDYARKKEIHSFRGKPPKFAISEFDPTLQNCVNFHDLLQCQINILDNGINELKTFAQYEYMNFYCLLIAIQHNLNIFYEPLKYQSELDLFEYHRILTYRGLFDLNPIIENPEKSKNPLSLALYECRNKLKSYISKNSKEHFYVIIEKKFKNRNNIQSKYNNFLDTQIRYIQKNESIKQIFARHYRILVTNAYTKDIMLETFLDAIKLQSCKAMKNLRHLVRLIPKEFNIFEMSEMNFIDALNRTNTSTLNVNKNFVYFNDRSKPWTNFYIPTDVEILKLESQTDVDVVFHYSQYNPYTFIEDTNNPRFFSQLKTFFKSPTHINKLENFRNFFFEEANLYQSNAFVLLQMTTFFINIINFKFLEIGMTQKSLELTKLLQMNDLGLDFWGDKQKEMTKFDLHSNERLPIIVVENIIHNENNYLTLRKMFDNIKIELSSIIQDMKVFMKKDTPDNNIRLFMQNYSNYLIVFWLVILYRSRELSLKTKDMNSFDFITRIISLFKNVDYFKSNHCSFPCHISKRSLDSLEKVNFNTKKLTNSLKTNFFNHFYLTQRKDSFMEINFLMKEFRENNFYYGDNFVLNYSDYSIYDKIKQDFLFITENKLGEMRNSCFKISNNTEKYMIYCELNRHNSDLILLNKKKTFFLEFYQRLSEFKYKFMIILKNKFVTVDSTHYERLENSIIKLYENYVSENFEDLDKNLGIKQRNIINSPNKKYNKKSSIIFMKIIRNDEAEESYKNLFKGENENEIKMENTQIVETFLNSTEKIYDVLKNEIGLFLMKKGVDALRKENLALKELFTQSRNDLDITKFQNKFSSNLLKELDEAHILNINKKFSFFETFINTIQNVSEEVETHAISNAFLIKKNEFEDAVKQLIKEYVIYDSNLQRNQHFAQVSEKFGYYFTIKKLEVWALILKDKLKNFDDNIEKISNAKLALAGNKLVYEMDNLYRQLKILKDNLVVMEDYIKLYFEEKSQSSVNNLKTELSQLESKFLDFKQDLVSGTVQKITEEYNGCLDDLKIKLNEISTNTKVKETVNISTKMTSNVFISNNHEFNVNNLNFEKEEGEFYDHFFREMEIEQNFNKEINKERKKIDNLSEDMSKLHAFYRIKLNLQKNNFEKELEELKQNLSSNKDLWDKLGIAERNEKILKEELSKTQKSLASAEEFIKKLQSQIRKLHDKNVNLEKQLSSMTAQQIMSNANKGENKMAMDLYNDTKQAYVYNMRNNISLLQSIERVKFNYPLDIDIQQILNNLELLHTKYAEEVDSKRKYINNLNTIKRDVEKMKDIDDKRVEELNFKMDQMNNENKKLKFELEKLKNHSVRLNSRKSSLISNNPPNINLSNNPVTNQMGNVNNISHFSLPGSISNNFKMKVEKNIKTAGVSNIMNSNLNSSSDKNKLSVIGQNIVFGGIKKNDN